MYWAEDDAEGQARLAAFAQALKQLGWSDGRNVRLDTRWASAADIRRHTAELVALAPDVILASGSPAVGQLLQATRTVPIVFVVVVDPVGSGFVESLARPSGNATGFPLFEYGISGKWLELLKEIAPNVRHVAVLRDSSNPAQAAQFGVIQAVAPMLKADVIPVGMHGKTASRDASTRDEGVSNLIMRSRGRVDKIEAALHPESTAPISSPSPIPEEGRGHISIPLCGPSVELMWRCCKFSRAVAFRTHDRRVLGANKKAPRKSSPNLGA